MSIVLNNIKITEFGADNFTFDSNVRFFHFQKYVYPIPWKRKNRKNGRARGGICAGNPTVVQIAIGRSPTRERRLQESTRIDGVRSVKKKEKIKTRRSGGERERCTISFMSDPLKFHSTIGSNLRPVRLSLRSKPVVSNLFPPSFVFWKARFEQRLIFTERNRFRDCFFRERGEVRKKLKRREREKRKKISEIFRGMLANAEGEIGNARFLVARELTRHTCEDKPAEMA